jgi:hypothetical protein
MGRVGSHGGGGGENIEEKCFQDQNLCSRLLLWKGVTYRFFYGQTWLLSKKIFLKWVHLDRVGGGGGYYYHVVFI